MCRVPFGGGLKKEPPILTRGTQMPYTCAGHDHMRPMCRSGCLRGALNISVYDDSVKVVCARHEGNVPGGAEPLFESRWAT